MASMKWEDTADHKCLVMMSSHICGVISLRVSTSSRISLRALSNSSFYRKQDFWGRRSIRDSLKGPNYFGAWRRRDLHATGRDGISGAYDIPTKLWRQSITVTLCFNPDWLELFGKIFGYIRRFAEINQFFCRVSLRRGFILRQMQPLCLSKLVVYMEHATQN